MDFDDDELNVAFRESCYDDMALKVQQEILDKCRQESEWVKISHPNRLH